mmetsp:Transcript_19292/g.35692  ORF Transcript_19292/g.35692 Transcript_19292/m.35692 type:complete len:178 (-) Transcript_19292:203-736(-)
MGAGASTASPFTEHHEKVKPVVKEHVDAVEGDMVSKKDLASKIAAHEGNELDEEKAMEMLNEHYGETEEMEKAKFDDWFTPAEQAEAAAPAEGEAAAPAEGEAAAPAEGEAAAATEAAAPAEGDAAAPAEGEAAPAEAAPAEGDAAAPAEGEAAPAEATEAAPAEGEAAPAEAAPAE